MTYLEKLQKIMAKESGGKDRQQHAFSTNLDQIRKLRLSELARRNIAIKIYSKILGCELWLCGKEHMAAQLRQGDPEIAVYTANEMRKLMGLNPNSEDLKRIHTVQTLFNSSKIID